MKPSISGRRISSCMPIQAPNEKPAIQQLRASGLTVCAQSSAAAANLYDFSFLAPCPSSGLIIHGDKDAVVPHRDVTTLVEKLKTQKGIVIEQKVIAGANHFFDGKIEPLMSSISAYLDKRLGKTGERRNSAA